jgi:TolB-like protein
MNRLKRLIEEIHRRSLWQVLGIYLVGAWIGYEVIQSLTEGIGLPDWVPGFAVVVFIIGLPIVLATALVQEGAPAASHEDSTPPPDDQVAPEARPPDARPGIVGLRQLLTWRNAIVAGAGIAMLALLAVSATGYMGLREAGIGPFGTLLTEGVLEERDRIVLADFENQTSDPLLAVAATQLFRTALSRSTAVHVAGQDYVAGVLRRMEREPDAPLDYDLAREVAVRQGLKAVTAGEVIAVGGSYVVSARLVAAETGEVLWEDSETARDSTAITDSIDRLSRRLRERIGESLRTIRGNRPLDQVTTGSLEALQKYSQGVRAIDVEADYAKGVGLLSEAVALDTAFAMAYLKLGHVSFLAENRTRTVEAFTRAYRHRDRLTDRERYITIAGYYTAVLHRCYWGA